MSDKWTGWQCIPGRICRGSGFMREAAAELERLQARLAERDETINRMQGLLETCDAGLEALRARLADFTATNKVLADELEQSLARLAEAERDIDAYRGALGYAVPGDHDGRLSDGSTPICGLCDARHRAADSADAALAAKEGTKKTL